MQVSPEVSSRAGQPIGKLELRGWASASRRGCLLHSQLTAWSGPLHGGWALVEDPREGLIMEQENPTIVVEDTLTNHGSRPAWRSPSPLKGMSRARWRIGSSTPVTGRWSLAIEFHSANRRHEDVDETEPGGGTVPSIIEEGEFSRRSRTPTGGLNVDER